MQDTPGSDTTPSPPPPPSSPEPQGLLEWLAAIRADLAAISKRLEEGDARFAATEKQAQEDRKARDEERKSRDRNDVVVMRYRR